MPPDENADDEDLWKVPTRPQVPVTPEDEPRPADRPVGHPGATAARPFQRAIAPIAALVLMGFAHVVPVLATGRVWARDEYGSSVIPAMAALEGHAPIAGAPSWNPHLFGGVPLESLPAMPRYPLNVFAYLVSPPTAAAIFVGIHLALAAATAWLFARRVAGASRPSALFGAMVYAFGGALWLRGIHPAHLAVAAWMPLVLRAVWDLFCAEAPERRRLFAFVLALTLGAVFLVGGGGCMLTLTSIFSAVMIADALSMRARAGIAPLRALRTAAPLFLAALAAAVLVGAPGLAPYLEITSGSGPNGPRLEAPLWATLMRLLLPDGAAVWPPSLQAELWLYAGVLTIPLAVIAGARDARGLRLALWAALAIVLAFFAPIATPGLFFIFAGLFLGGLGARGLDALIADPGTRRAAYIAAAILAAIGLAAAFFPTDDTNVRLALVFLAAKAFLAAAWLGGAGRAAAAMGQPKRRLVAAAAVIVLGTDLMTIALRLRADEPASALEPPAVLVEAAREAGNNRLYHDDAAGPRALGGGQRWGYRNARGFSYQVPAQLTTLLDLGGTPRPRFTAMPERLDPRLLRLLGVGVYVAAEETQPPPGFAMKPFASGKGLAAWKALEPPFETAVVSDVVIAPSPELEASSAISIDTSTTAVVARDVGLPARAPGAKREPAGRVVQVARVDAEHIDVTVEADRDALVVVGEGFHPRWRARVDREPGETTGHDGDPARVVRANAIWMGVRVPQGMSIVKLSCAPAVRWWMWLAMLAGIGASVALWPRGKIRA